MSLLFTLASSVLGLTIQDPVKKVGGLHDILFQLHNNVTDEVYSSVVSRVGGKKTQVGKVKTAYALMNDTTLSWLLGQDEHIKVVGYHDPEILELYSNPFGSCPSGFSGSSNSWGITRLTQKEPVSGSIENPKGEFKYNKNWGKDVAMYVLDTGVRLTHEEFQGTTVYCEGNGCKPHGTIPAIREHGTMSASTASGLNLGASKASVIVSYHFQDREKWSLVSKDCAERKATGEVKACVVTMSFGGSFPPGAGDILLEVLEALHDEGIHLVAAAGNSNQQLDLYKLPAGSPHVLAVGATDITDTAAKFSDNGPKVEIWAPGVSTKAASIQSDTSIGWFSGTSSACPHVAGVLGVIVGNNPALTPDEAKKILLEGSLKGVLDLSGKPGTQHNNLAHIPCDA